MYSIEKVTIMHIDNDMKLDFSDVLIRPKRSTLESRQDVNLFRTIQVPYSSKELTFVPVMNANMGTSGTFEIAEILLNNGCLATVHKHFSAKQWETFVEKTTSNIDNLFFPIGMNMEDIETLKHLNKGKAPHNRIKAIMIDVANGYSQKFIDHVAKVRESCPKYIIAAGNVVTAEMTEALIIAGADMVKVNIGAGSMCSTRLKAGVGYPQLSAVIECADAALGMGGHVISDGGCTHVADFSKALGAGATIAMSGSFFAGCDESGGDVYFNSDTGEKYCINYGMSSRTAQDKFGDGLKEYRSSEGRTAKIPYTGPVEGVIQDILGGIRSTCTYVGAKSIKELPKRTTFIRVNNTHNRTFENTTIGD